MDSEGKPRGRQRGRPLGSPNKATAEIRDLARQWGPAAIEGMAKLAGLVRDEHGNVIGAAEAEQVRFAAMNALCDRGFGRPAQALTGESGEGPFKTELRICWIGTGIQHHEDHGQDYDNDQSADMTRSCP